MQYLDCALKEPKCRTRLAPCACAHTPLTAQGQRLPRTPHTFPRVPPSPLPPSLSPSRPPTHPSFPHSQQEPGSPCAPFVGQVQSQKESIASQSCDNPIEVAATPTPECCALAMQFQPCACDEDVHATSGKTLAIASYRSTAYVCGGKCVNPPKC